MQINFSKFNKYEYFRRLTFVADPKPGLPEVPYDPCGLWTPTHGNHAQAEFHKALDRGVRFAAIFGGSGLGKSMAAAREGEIVALKPNTTTWLVGSKYNLTGKEFRYMWEDMIVTMRLPTVQKAFDERNGKFFIKFPWGAVIEGKSEEVEENLLGEGLDCLILCEGAKLKHRTYVRYLKRAIARRQGKVICNTTPAGYNWVYDEFYIPAQKGNPLYWAEIFDCLNNPFYSREEYQRQKEELTPEIFQEQFEGRFVRFSGLVFNNFDRRLHCRPGLFCDGDWPLWMMIDLNQGRGHCVEFFTIAPFNNQRRFIDEIWHKCTLPELSEMVRQKLRSLGGRPPNLIVYDGPEIDSSDDGVHLRRLMAEAGIRGKKPRKISKGAQFIQMNNLLNQKVATEHGQEPLILIDSSKVARLPWELEHLEWHQTKSEKSERMVPVDKNDDAIDCWRYAEAEGVNFDLPTTEQFSETVDFGRPRYQRTMG